MDESYLKFARSLVNLGETFEQVCRVAAPTSPKVGMVRARGYQFVKFGSALSDVGPTVVGAVIPSDRWAAAADRIEHARECLLEVRAADRNKLRAALFDVDAAISDVLPGIPDLPDLPKPEPVPSEDLAEVLAGLRGGRSRDKDEV